MTKNKLAKTAHAHVHLVLTPGAISTLTTDKKLEKFNEKYILYVLNLSGCYRDPIDYEYNDAITLQSSRLLSYHIEKTGEDVSSIKRNLDGLKENVEYLKNNTITQANMEKLMDEMFAKFYKQLQSGQPSLSTMHSGIDQLSPLTVPLNDQKSPISSETSPDINSSSQISLSATGEPVPQKLSKGQKKKKKAKRKKETQVFSPENEKLTNKNQ